MSRQQQVEYAKLVRGRSYTFDKTVYLKDEWRQVSAPTKNHLVDNAVDLVTVNNGGGLGRTQEQRQKFVFGIGTTDLNPDEYEASLRKDDEDEEEGQKGRGARPRTRTR